MVSSFIRTSDGISSSKSINKSAKSCGFVTTNQGVGRKAAQRMGYHIGGIWRVLSHLSLIVPSFLGDAIYSFVFRNRIRWFGRPTTCPRPDPAVAHRFLGA